LRFNQVVISAKNKDLRLGKNRRQKVILRVDLGSKFFQRVDRRTDISPELPLSSSNRCHNIAERHFPDYQQVDVTVGPEFSSRPRSKHERCAYLARDRFQSETDDVHKSGGFGEQALQLREDRRLLIGLKIHLPTTDVTTHEASRRQLFKLALNRANRAARVPYELP
jgi:hypothetical protein